MQIDADGNVGNARILKFKVAHLNGGKDVFGGAGPPQQLNDIDYQWQSHDAYLREPWLFEILVEETGCVLLLDGFFGLGWW